MKNWLERRISALVVCETELLMSKDMRVLTWKDLWQLSCLDSCWFSSVLAESTVFLSQNHHTLSSKQLCRDVELTLMNESANNVFSLIEMHEHLKSSHFFGSSSTIENPTLACVILNERFVGCRTGNGEAEHVQQQ